MFTFSLSHLVNILRNGNCLDGLRGWGGGRGLGLSASQGLLGSATVVMSASVVCVYIVQDLPTVILVADTVTVTL